MKKISKITLTFFLSCFIICSFAFSQSIGGYKYGKQQSPTGKEWESPEDLALNKEYPRAYFFSFQDIASARKVLPENSNYWMSLDGTWKFNWVKTPEERPVNFYNPSTDISKWDDVNVPMSWNIYGIQKDGSLKYGVPIYVNQKVIFWHQVKEDDWRGGVMRTPPVDWTTYIYRNEVGSYRRNFTIPAGWKGREVFINFDGVDAFFYLWINGQYVGFSKNSRNVASFDITDYLNEKGDNVVAVEVYRNSDGSFLESQDMFRLPGIFRSVSLTSTPKTYIRDIIAIPNLDENYQNGSLTITTDIRNLNKTKANGYKMTYSLYANEIYSDNNSPVKETPVSVAVPEITPENSMSVKATVKLDNPNKWSSERPYRYTLIGELKDSKGRTIETISTIVGFRKVEVKDTKAKDDEFGLAGRYFYINGKAIKLKGVNRHESNPEYGHAISRKQMEDEIMMMKRANINHVRNSHYPTAPYWYYLCDKYGIYLEDEANVESHQYYYGKESLSHPVEWKNAHVARNLEMVHATVNHPSIAIWSLGNEAGPGDNFKAAYNAIKEVDISRPVQYERNNSIVDIGSNQYPSIPWVREAVKGTYGLKYPFHISEYAHSMGNASGNLIDYWDAMESTNFFMGGAIWDWIDQAMYYYDKKTGERFFAYGGDFGDYPNDGMFVMNGIMFADMTPKPQYYEVKKVYQNIGVKAVDLKNGKIEIFNKNYFIPLTDYVIQWSLYEDGKEIEKSFDFGGQALPNPRQKQIYTLPFDYNKLKPQSEYFVKVQFMLKEDLPWANKGYIQMAEQLPVKPAIGRPAIASTVTGDKLNISTEQNLKVVKGKDFVAKFDTQTGTIYSLAYNDKNMIREGCGPKLDAFRAPVDNDNWAYKQWIENGLHNLHHKTLSDNVYTKPDGTVVLSFTVLSQAPNRATIQGGSSGKFTITENKDQPLGQDGFKFITNQVWNVYKDGSIELQSSITSNNPSLVLARLGYAMQIPEELSDYSYYGRGPVNNYADRKTGQFIEIHQSPVKDLYVNWPKPQSTGNREDVRWCSMTNNSGNGIIIIATDRLSTSALPWSALEMTLAPHTYQLPKSSGTHLHLDIAVTGLGGNSCGQGGPLEDDRVNATPHTMGFIIRPLKNKDFTAKANVAPSGDKPITISRSRMGKVTISSGNPDEEILYTVDNNKQKEYKQSFDLREGGRVTAWYKNNENLRTFFDFSKIETIPMEVFFTSSEESGYGDASHLVDGDPSTIWHTVYSRTVSKYPHWVDFDAGEVKIMKGFTYLPRQDGSRNGNVKEYKIEVGMDGKTWGTVAAQGSFENNTKLQKVIFTSPVKARYIRFTALSSQDGRDFASGAEFTVLAE